MMNRQEFKSKWDRFCPDLKNEWSQFTKEDLQEVKGEYHKFSSLIQQRYPDQNQEVSDWADRWYLLDQSYLKRRP
jgi:uncharacterized protein YjbJ (UPF0337 family)